MVVIMRKSFNIFRLFIAVIMAGAVCVTITSCEPDDVESFVTGYWNGYNSTHTRTANTDIPEAQETDTNAEQ